MQFYLLRVNICNRYSFCRFIISSNLYCNTSSNILSNQYSHSYWMDVKNQRKFLESISSKLRIKILADWKYIRVKDIEDYGGGELLKLYPSYFKAIQTIFPEKEWNQVEFDNLPNYFYSSIDNQRSAMDHICKVLNLSSPLDLASLSKKTLEKHGNILLHDF